MKLLIVSDLHREHWRYSKFWDGLTDLKDVYLVLAGDIFGWGEKRGEKQAYEEMENLVDAFKGVLYLPGNHEFYGTRPEYVHHDLNKFAHTFGPEGLRVLNNQAVTIEDRHILGGIGYVPKVPAGTGEITDGRLIKAFRPWYHEEHDRFRAMLDNNLRSGDIVISHHAPSNKSVSPEFVGNSYNPWFIAPDLEEYMVGPEAPSLWIHGHVHSSWDYQFGNTRVICNPLGYEHEGQSDHFNPRLIIEV